MVLTDKEKNGALKILSLLPDTEVVSLARTVTKGQIHVGTRKEAVRAIIVYSDNPAELLRRKKVRREVLFKYADQEQIAVKPDDEKLTLIQRILHHFGSRPLPVGYNVDDEDDASPQNAVCVTHDHENNAFAANDYQHTANRARHGEGPQLPHNWNWWRDRTLRQLADDQEFATQFAVWFYAKLNGVTDAPNSFGIEHFFNDATLALLVVTTGHENSVEHFDGADLVVRRLVALIIDERLVLNANQSEDGVNGMSDPHGRRVVFVCGTVHRENTVLGLFEQQFALVRDPSAENNWKICSMRLALSTRAPSQLPTLAMTQNMLMG